MTNQKSDLLSEFSEGSELYLFNSPEGKILFRLLKIKDFETTIKASQSMPSLVPELEEAVWERCVVEHMTGKTLTELKAGTISSTAQMIMNLSGPTSKRYFKETLIRERSKVQTFVPMLVLRVCEAFPGYKPEEVEEMDWDTLMKRVAQAEKILGKEFPLDDENKVELLEGEAQDGFDIDEIERELRGE